MSIADEIIADEVNCIASGIAKRAVATKAKWIHDLSGKLVVMTDGSALGRFLARAYADAYDRCDYIHQPVVIDLTKRVAPETSMREKDGYTDHDLLFVCVDCNRSAQASDKVFAALEKLLEAIKSLRIRVLVGVVMPSFPAFPDGIRGLSEREFGYYIEHKVERTPEIDYYLRLESIFRRVQRSNGCRITLVRFANVFSPDDSETAEVGLGKIVDESFQRGFCAVTEEDVKCCYGLTTVRSACLCLHKMVSLERTVGKIYQFYDYEVTVEDIKRVLVRSFRNRLGLKEDIGRVWEIKSKLMSRLRIKALKIGSECPLDIAIKRVANFRTNLPYDNHENLAFYEGRIMAIQREELDILLEIDRICRKHGIQYFLAGGTLLGQVRCQGPIPWDDDLDIGMLRRDFERFRRVADRELGSKYCYTCPYNQSGSHYTIDKVRIRDSYFSTRYSSANVFQDGLFVDILVYDQTSNVTWLRNLQLWILSVLTFVLEVKWFNRARKRLHYRFSLVALPVMRLIPFRFFHVLFDWVARWFEGAEDAEYLIDTVGKKLRDGPMPFKGMKEVVYADFAGIKAPIPIDPVPYLTYAFGPNYMEQPPLSSRCCPHHFARIDLGRYVFPKKDDDMPDRQVDLRGELFESEMEEEDCGI